MTASEDEIRKLLAKIEGTATASRQTLQEMIEITRSLGSTIRGPVPPRMEELETKLGGDVDQLGTDLDSLRAAYARTG